MARASVEGDPRTDAPNDLHSRLVGSDLGRWIAGLILLVAVVGNAVPFVLFYVALGRGDAGRVSAWFFLVPVIGVLTAWPLLGEVPGPRLWAGLVLVCAGLWLVLAPRRR